jgi:hypothetical protein
VIKLIKIMDFIFMGGGDKSGWKWMKVDEKRRKRCGSGVKTNSH